MTALYAIYGRLFEGASVDVVVYSASLPAGKFVVISALSPPNDCSVVLRLDSKRSHLTASNDILTHPSNDILTHPSNDILTHPSNDILTHPWVLDTLGISDGNQISVSFFNECIVQSDESLNINMSFVQTISYKHWDEVCITSISDLIKGGNSYLWPSSIDKQLFCKLLPSLLTGKYIRSGMIVPVAYLDSILLFKVNSIAQVDSISPDHNVYLLKHSQSINISCDFIQSTSVATADHPAVAEDAFEKEIKDYSACMSDSYIATQFYKVMNICSQVLHSNRQWKGCRSALVTAIEGGGKSYFLKLVKYSTVKAAHINECSYRNASHIVSKELVVLTITAATLRKVETEVDCTSFNQYTQDVNVKIAALLQQLCMLLQVPITANMLAPTTPILLLIDDIADFYRDPDDEESAGSRTADDSAIALILKDLLHLVNNESLAWRVVVISTARITPGATKRMAATNSLQTYFKHEIVVSLQKPSSNDRKVIIEALLRRNNHFQLENIAEEGGGSDDDVVKVWSAKLALITTGYVPGDIVTLVKRLSNATSTPVLWRSALELLSTMPPKQLTLIDQGSAVQQEKTLTWDNFGGYRPQKESIMKLFRAFQHVKEANNELLQQIYSKLPRGIVLYGPSGCGKTYMARVIASVSNMNFVSVKSTDILSKYYGQTEEVLRSIFSKARSAAPCILFFDEFDTIACKREISDQNSDGTGSVYNRILSTFLNELDGICNRGDSSGSSFEREVLVVTACLDITLLDEALIRPGRLHYHILLEKPTYDDVVDILELEIKRNNSSAYDDTVDIPLIATSIMRTSPSSNTVVSLCKQAIAYALREAITSQRELETVPGELNSKSIKVSQTHFSQVLRAQNAL